jgi:hypothetical protein
MRNLLFCPRCIVELIQASSVRMMRCPDCRELYSPDRCSSDNQPGARCQLPAGHYGPHFWD